MRVRTRSALIALALFIPFIYLGGGYFAGAVAVLGIVALYELARMAQIPFGLTRGLVSLIALLSMLLPQHYAPNFVNQHIDISVFFYLCCLLLLIDTVFRHRSFNFTQAAILMLGALYIGSGFRFLILIRDMGIPTLMFLFIIIWSTDIGAYLVGRQYGKRQLAPAISPGKTVEGLLGGIGFSLVSALVFLFFFPMKHGGVQYVPLLIIFMSLFGQLGDLVESAYKRLYGVKDSGKILPGHGGILDRFDSTLFASIIMMVWTSLFR